MQIQLKQAEIITALKGYISSQGISLANKSVDITFTAGRKEGGLTADLIIEDEVVETVQAVRHLHITKQVSVEREPASTVAETIQPEPEPDEVVAEAKTASLFS